MEKHCHKFNFSSLLALGLFLLPQTLLADTTISTGFWNGFLNQFNVIECINVGTEELSLRLTVKDNNSITLGERQTSIPSKGSTHLILNELDITNRYGTYSLIASGQTPDALQCHTAVYRFANPGGRKTVEYAYSLPVNISLSGTTAGTFNSISPEGGTETVFNWLSIYNREPQPFSANIEIRAINGSLINTLAVTSLASEQRIDIGLGHDSGQMIGLYRIIPTNGSSTYAAFLTRYSPNGSGFNFAIPLVATSGGCNYDPITASTMNPATNYAEIANLSPETKTYHLEVRDRAGELLHHAPVSLPLAPFSQQHVDLNQYLGEGNVGSFQLTCPTGGTVLAQSLFYGRRSVDDSRLEWAYASQPRAVTTAHPSFPVNTFLGAANWLKLFNPHSTSLELAVDTSRENGGLIDSTQHDLLPGGGLDFGIHQFVPPDRIALSTARHRGLSSNRITGEMIRVYPTTSGTIGYIMNIVPGQEGIILPDGSSSSISSSSFSSDSSNSSSSVNNSDPSPSSSSSSSSSSFADESTLVLPGPGPWDPDVITPEPSRLGQPNDPGYGSQVIARWDVVPYQTFNDEIQLGVVAFHYNGIDRVEFSVNQGQWTPVHQMTFNPQSNVWEYTIKLRARDFASQAAVEVRAIAYPRVAGRARVLSGPATGEFINGEVSLRLFANHSTQSYYVATYGNDSSGTGSIVSPFRTIRRALNQLTLPADDGAEIVLLDADPQGWEVLPRNVSPVHRDNYLENRRWIKIAPYPTLGNLLVRQRSTRDIQTGVQRTHFSKLIFDFSTLDIIGAPAYRPIFPNAVNAYWQDRVQWIGPGYEVQRPFAPVVGVESGVAFYTTNSLVEEMYDGFVSHVLSRGNHHRRISGDNFQNSQVLINNTIDDIGGPCNNCFQHADIFQYFASYFVIGVGFPDGSGNPQGLSWNGTTRTLHTSPAYQNVFLNFTPTPRDRLYIISGTGVIPGAYEIEEIVDPNTIRLRTSIAGQGAPINLNSRDIQAAVAGTVENTIAYGIKASRVNDTQNWRMDYAHFEDMAFVNVAIDNHIQADTASQALFYDSQHILFFNVSVPRKILFLNYAQQATDIRITNSVVETIFGEPGGGLAPGILCENTHLNYLYYDNATGYSNSITVGSPFVDGNLIGREGRGTVQLTFDGPSNTGSFSHIGSDAPLLFGTGRVIPGYRSWPWASEPTAPRNRGAF